MGLKRANAIKRRFYGN